MDDKEKRLSDVELKLYILMAKLSSIDAGLAELKQDIRSLEEKASSEVRGLKSNLTYLSQCIIQNEEFTAAVVDKVFPDLLKNYVEIGERFSGSEPDKRKPPSTG